MHLNIYNKQCMSFQYICTLSLISSLLPKPHYINLGFFLVSLCHDVVKHIYIMIVPRELKRKYINSYPSYTSHRPLNVTLSITTKTIFLVFNTFYNGCIEQGVWDVKKEEEGTIMIIIHIMTLIEVKELKCGK